MNKPAIIDWLIENQATVNSITYYLNQEAQVHLKHEPIFEQEIIQEFKFKVIYDVAEEISRQLGYPIDIIFEVLEEPNIQEYLFENSICCNSGARTPNAI